MRLIKTFSPLLFTLTIVFTTVGCATLNREDIPRPDELQELEPLKAEPAYDVYLLRIDLMRQYTEYVTTTTDSQGRIVQQRHITPVPYHYIGVDLGNGIFLDANMNLSLNLIELMKLRNRKSFRFVFKSDSAFGEKRTISRQGDHVVIDYGGLFSSKTDIDLRPNGATFRGGVLSSDQDINVLEDRIVYDPHSIFGSWRETGIIKTESGARIPGFWHDTEIELHNGVVQLGSGLTIEGGQKEIIFRFSRWFFSDKVYRYLRSDKRIMFFNDDLHGVQIDFLPDRIRINQILEGVGRGKWEIIFEE